jgi:hypothetical protein
MEWRLWRYQYEQEVVNGLDQRCLKRLTSLVNDTKTSLVNDPKDYSRDSCLDILFDSVPLVGDKEVISLQSLKDDSLGIYRFPYEYLDGLCKRVNMEKHIIFQQKSILTPDRTERLVVDYYTFIRSDQQNRRDRRRYLKLS